MQPEDTNPSMFKGVLISKFAAPFLLLDTRECKTLQGLEFPGVPKHFLPLEPIC